MKKMQLVMYVNMSLFLLFVSKNYSQSTVSVEQLFEHNSLYFICRGTKSKMGLIAEQFNITDKKITHVGLGFYTDDGKFSIFNMSVDKNHPFLIVDDWISFKGSDTYYISVWKSSVTSVELAKLSKICKEILQHSPKFDFQFNLETKNEFYCSEFCAFVLNKIYKKKGRFLPQVKELNFFYQKVLHRERLEYYSVDFFQNRKNIEKIYEQDNLQ